MEMLRLAEPGGCLTMSTAYLNLARPFERALASATRVSTHNSAMVSTLPDCRNVCVWCKLASAL